MLKLHFTSLHIRLRFMQVCVILACEGLKVGLLPLRSCTASTPSVPNRSGRPDLDSNVPVSRRVRRSSSSTSSFAGTQSELVASAGFCDFAN